MKRTNHSLPNTTLCAEELLKQIVFHEAGHVAAIFIRNQQQKLPPVYFQIINKKQQKHHAYFAQILGGRLIDKVLSQ